MGAVCGGSLLAYYFIIRLPDPPLFPGGIPCVISNYVTRKRVAVGGREWALGLYAYGAVVLVVMSLVSRMKSFRMTRSITHNSHQILYETLQYFHCASVAAR